MLLIEIPEIICFIISDDPIDFFKKNQLKLNKMIKIVESLKANFMKSGPDMLNSNISF